MGHALERDGKGAAHGRAAVGQCLADDDNCDQHNNYAEPELDSQDQAQRAAPRSTGCSATAGTATRFEQIPFQVDEMFTRYLDNAASGFAVYSGEDQHTTYAFDREGFRFTEQDPDNPCLARPANGQATTPDPVSGLDDNDELVFMASDAADPPPQTPRFRRASRTCERSGSPIRRTRRRRGCAYVAKAAADGPEPAYNADNGYVHYERDANADLFEKSESSYDNYGNAARGTVCDENGNIVGQDERRRPRDYATVTTDRYRFRYDGRWLMTDLAHLARRRRRPSAPTSSTAGRRAHSSRTRPRRPRAAATRRRTRTGAARARCSASAPARCARSARRGAPTPGTNVIRRETFYRDEVRQKSYLRVHVIPPLDGIYAQWDFNAGRMTRSTTRRCRQSNPEGVAIDGVNDEVFGNLDDPCNSNYDDEHDERHRPAVPRALQLAPGPVQPVPAGRRVPAVRARGRLHQRLHRQRPDRSGPARSRAVRLIPLPPVDRPARSAR